MRVIVPIEMTDIALVSSNIPENDYPEWDAATDYTIGDSVIRTTTHRIYENLVGGVDPTYPENATGGPTPQWLDVGPTNRWAMFDDVVGTVSKITGESLVVEIDPGVGISAISLMELQGENAIVTVYDSPGGDVVYSKNEYLDGAIITSFYDWFFEPHRQKSSVVFLGIPDHLHNPRVRIEITPYQNISACGVAKLGPVRKLGGTKYGVGYGITDFSKKERNEFGRFVIVPRPFSKKLNAQLIFERALFPLVEQTLSDLRTTPSVWIADDAPGYEPLFIFGFCSDFSVDIDYFTHFYCTLEIEGLI